MKRAGDDAFISLYKDPSEEQLIAHGVTPDPTKHYLMVIEPPKHWGEGSELAKAKMNGYTLEATVDEGHIYWVSKPREKMEEQYKREFQKAYRLQHGSEADPSFISETKLDTDNAIDIDFEEMVAAIEPGYQD